MPPRKPSTATKADSTAAKRKTARKPKAKVKAASEGIAPTVVLGNTWTADGKQVTGRPSDYDPIYCDRVIEWGKDGKSITWMAAEIGVCKDTVYEWIKVHPAFSDAIKRAKVFCQRWWEDAGQVGMTSDKFNSAVWAKNMAARFRDEWTDRQETAHMGADGGAIRHDIAFVIVDPASN